MGTLNIKKFIISMLIFLAFFLLLNTTMVIIGYWFFFSRESLTLMGLGFCFSAIINLLKPENNI